MDDARVDGGTVTDAGTGNNAAEACGAKAAGAVRLEEAIRGSLPADASGVAVRAGGAPIWQTVLRAVAPQVRDGS